MRKFFYKKQRIKLKMDMTKILLIFYKLKNKWMQKKEKRLSFWGKKLWKSLFNNLLKKKEKFYV